MDQTKRKRLSSSDVLNVFSNKRVKTAVDTAPEQRAPRQPGKLRRMASREGLSDFFNKRPGISTANSMDQPGNRHTMFEMMTMPYNDAPAAAPPITIDALPPAAPPDTAPPVATPRLRETPGLRRPGSLVLLFRNSSIFNLGATATNATEPDEVSPATIADPELPTAAEVVRHVHVDHPGEWPSGAPNQAQNTDSNEPSAQQLKVRQIVTDGQAHRDYMQVAQNAPDLAAAQGNPQQLTVPTPFGPYLYTNEDGVPWPADVQISLARADADMARQVLPAAAVAAADTITTAPQSVVRRQRAATCIGCEVKYHQLRAAQWQIDYQMTGRAADPKQSGIDLERYRYVYHLQKAEEEEREQRDSVLQWSVQSAGKKTSDASSSVAVGTTQEASAPHTEAGADFVKTVSPEAVMAGREVQEFYMSGALDDRSVSEYSTTRSGELADQMSICSSRFQPEDLDAVMAALSFADAEEDE